MTNKGLTGIVYLWLLISQLKFSLSLLVSKHARIKNHLRLTNRTHRNQRPPIFQRKLVLSRQIANDNDCDGMPSTMIEEGTKVRAEQFTSTNPVVVSGELEILQKLECEMNVFISNSGCVEGDVVAINGAIKVDGELQGNVECVELIVGPTGEVSGDVLCRDL